MAQLVFVPGLAGDAVMWHSQIDALAAWHPAVSDVHMRHASIERMASSLLADHSGPLILCGASMGGMVAMEAARQAPERIAGLALLGTTARPESEAMRRVRQDAIQLFAQGQVLEVIEPNVHLAFHPDQAAKPDIVSAYLEFVLRAGAAQLIRQNRAIMARPDARVHLPQLDCPALVMCGDADQLVPAENSQEIASLLRGSELVVVPRCGHMLTMEQPATVNAALASWLGRLSA